MKTKELRKLKDEDLNKKLEELRLELMKEIASIKMKKARKNTKRARNLRRTIARILTILNERKMGIRK